MMDNDTIPCKTALEKLMVHMNDPDKNPGFLSSVVKWIDGRPCLMNIPTVGDFWPEYLSEKLVRLKSASFVSLFIPRNSIDQVGYPIKEFFIWGDDVEFTNRITQKRSGYLVTDSVVIHKMGKNETTDIIKDDPKRINRYFYDFRNSIYIAKKSGGRQLLKIYVRLLTILFKILIKQNDFKMKKINILLKGMIAGIFFNPKIETAQNSLD
jgi:GT2 family glycosyltransferase